MLLTVLGILLTSFLVGGIATVLLYRSQTDNLMHQLSFALELQTTALEAELGRLEDIASQIASRSHIREKLGHFLHGETTLSAVQEFTAPPLQDAMVSDSGILGITRLGTAGEPLLSVGAPIPRSAWPDEPSTVVTGVGRPTDGRIVVSAPIRDNTQRALGTDLVMLRDDRLQAILRGFLDHIEAVGDIRVVALEGDRLVDLYRTGLRTHRTDETLLLQRLGESRSEGDATGTFTLDDVDGRELLLAFRTLSNTNWLILFESEHDVFFAAARRQAVVAALAVLALALLGIALTRLATSPLVAEISAERHRLQDLLGRNAELLETIKADQSRLQAVIDNAPEIIYIKDPLGRYVLVNSSYERLVDRPRGQIVGKFDHQLFAEDFAASTRLTDREVLASGAAVTVDEKPPTGDAIQDFLVTKFPLLDEQGKVNGICGIATDITERKRIEHRLALTQNTVDHVSIGVYWADADGRLIYLNDAARKALAFDTSEAVGLSVAQIAPGTRQADWNTHWQALKQGGSLRFESSHRRADGEEFPIEVHANHLAFDDQEFYIAVFHDISARLESEQRLKLSATVFDSSTEAIVITDPQGVVLDVNQSFTRILGFTRDEVIGKTPNLWRSDRHDDAFYEEMWRSIIDTGAWRGELINRSKNGVLTAELVAINAVRDEAGEVTSYVAIYTDISHLKESQQKLAHLAHHDALTGLPNRALFNERLQHALERAARRHGQVAAIFVDLDNFKHVNDSLGHEYGDELLVQVARLLASVLRQEDTVARIGGDEFTVLIEEFDVRTSLASVIEKVIDAFDREFVLGAAQVRVTPSIGVAVSPDDGKDANTLMRNADAAMYRAKALGRNTYQFYTEDLTRQAFERMLVDSALRNAIRKGEFDLRYQPQVDLASGEIVGVEVLARWYNPDLGQVSPDRFIPVAEDNGAILQIGEWVLRESCRQAREWLDQGLLSGTLAVNISGTQVRRGDLAELVKRVLLETGLPAANLELEVTESFIMGESAQAIEVLRKVRELGVVLAIDDFGTGYSSLSYLKSLPVQRLKIDKSFIRDIPDDPNDIAITRAVIALAKSLNLNLVGEGVETETQRRFLVDEGCQFGQGYLLYRPMSASDLQHVLVDQALQPNIARLPRKI